jgi:hypothetical protein
MSEFLPILQWAMTAIIALIGPYIAWQQWQKNRNQFLLHFFDPRGAVYDAVTKLASRLLQKGTLTREELSEYISNARAASFLFNDKIQRYCD